MSRKVLARGAPDTAAHRYGPKELKGLWGRLHQSDLEPWPDASAVGRIAAGSPVFAEWVDGHGGARGIAAGLRVAWTEFHAGAFAEAMKLGEALGALGACVANRAAAVDSLYTRRSAHEALEMLLAAVARGERAAAALPDYPNAHYTLALVLGRYSQRISIVRALSEGLAARVKRALDRTLALEPRHAEARVALGLYHAEIVSKLGRLAASVTYGASPARALEHFRRAMQLAPRSAIVRIEYAQALMMLDADRNRGQAEQLYRDAAACEPIDAMEELDVARARRGLER